MMFKPSFLLSAVVTAGLAGVSYAGTSLQVTNGFSSDSIQVAVDHHAIVMGASEMAFLNFGGGASVTDVCESDTQCKHFVVVDSHEPCGATDYSPTDDTIEPPPEDPAVTEDPAAHAHLIELATYHRENLQVSGWHLNFYADGMYVGDVCTPVHGDSVAHAELRVSDLGDHVGSDLAVLSEAGDRSGVVFAW